MSLDLAMQLPPSKDSQAATCSIADLQTCCAGMVSSSLELHRYATDRQTRVVTALTLLKSHLFKCAYPYFLFLAPCLQGSPT